MAEDLTPPFRFPAEFLASFDKSEPMKKNMKKQPTSKPSASLVPGTVTALYEFSKMPDFEGDVDTPNNLNATVGVDLDQRAGMTSLRDGCLVNNDTRTCYAAPSPDGGKTPGGLTGRYVHLEFTPSEVADGMKFLCNGGLTGTDPLPQNVSLQVGVSGSILLIEGDLIKVVTAPIGTLNAGSVTSVTLDLGAVYTFRNFGCHPSNLNGCWQGSFDQLKLSV
jgi:hypothetical protein